MNILDQVITDEYSIYNADCIEVARDLPDNSIDFSVYSPPFSSLYTKEEEIIFKKCMIADKLV